MPEISVVITTYNEEKYIESAIKSAENQTLNKDLYEIIVVDDGGSDNTDQIIHKLKKNGSQVKYFKKKNGGTASARNFGISKAEGNYISFLDGDDTYFPRKLERSLNAMLKGQNIAIVYSDYIEKYPDKAQIRLKQNFSREMLFQNCIVSTNSMVKKEALEIVGGFDETFKYVEDYDLWCRLAIAGFFALRVPEVLFTYNSHPNSKTNSAGLERIEPEWARIRERIMKNEWRIKK